MLTRLRIAMMVGSRLSLVHSLAALLAIGLLASACQTETTQDTDDAEPKLPESDLVVEDPWVEPAAAGDSTFLYATIANGRTTADTLIGARAPIFGGAHIHTAPSDTAAGLSAATLTIPARRRTHLAPDSVRLVLTNLSKPLEQDGTLLVTLEFAQSGLQQVRAPVRSPSTSNGQ